MTRSIPNSARFEDFRALVLGRARAWAWSSRSISPCNALPIIPGSSSIRTGSHWRPDGSINFAENPPKKYEDIVNIDFYAPRRGAGAWLALRDIVLYWIDAGVRIFRVDNPHTKPFPFWEWLIADIRARHPDVDLPGGSLHAAEDHVSPGQARLFAVLHLLHLAQHQARTDGISDAN